MATKVGNKLWVPKIPNKLTSSSGILMIGIENYGDQINKNMNILSFCSNSDRYFSEFYSNFLTHKKGEDKTYINEVIFQCMTDYYRYNGEAPSDLIIMKNGSTKYDNSTMVLAEVN